MKLMRGDKIHSSLQFQGWRSRDLKKVQRLMWGKRSLLRDIMEDGSSNISVCERVHTGVCDWKNMKDMLMHPAGMNLFEGLRFPHNRSLLSSSYTKSRSVLFLNNSQEYYRYGPRMLWKCSKWILMVDVTDAGAGPGHGEVIRVWIITFWIFRKTNVCILLSLASWQEVTNILPSSIT